MSVNERQLQDILKNVKTGNLNQLKQTTNKILMRKIDTEFEAIKPKIADSLFNSYKQ